MQQWAIADTGTKYRTGGELHSRYNVCGNLLEEVLPNRLVTQFAYDGENNLIHQLDNTDRY